MQGADGFFKIFSRSIRQILKKAKLDFEALQEIRMRIDRPLMVRQGGEEYSLTEEGIHFMPMRTNCGRDF